MLRAGRWSWPWAALPLAAVLAVDPRGLAPFGPAKWALVPALVLAGTAAVALAGRRPLSVAAWQGFALPAFVVWAGVTALFGLDHVYAWTGTPERHFGVIAWLLVLLSWWGGRSLDDAARRVVLASATIATAAMGAWAAAEALGWRPLHLVGVGDRTVGPLGSSAFLGAAAVLLAPVAIGVAAASKRRLARGAAAIAAAGGLVALAASGARAAFVGAAVAAVVAIVVHRRRAIVATVAGCVLVVVVVALATGAAGRVGAIASDREGGARGRLDEWRVALRVVAAHPVLGTGPEGYRVAFGRAVDDHYEREHGRDPLPDRAHNALLDVAATTGLIGLSLYLLAIGGAITAAVTALRRGSPLVAGAAVGVIAYFAQSLFLFPIAELEPVAWLLVGVCATGARNTPPPSATSPRRAVAALASVLALVALAAGVLDVASDRRAKTILADLANDRVAPTNAAELRPDHVRYRLVDARAAANGSSRGLARAIADVDHALRVSPSDPVARSERSRLLLIQARRSSNAVPGARSYLEQLADDDPRNAEVLLRLGVVRDLAGDPSGAIAAWRRAEYLAPRSASASSNLAVAYAHAGRTAEARAAAARALRRDPHNETARGLLDSLGSGNGT